MAGYEPIKPPRFSRESVPGGYEFVIRARKNWFAIPFLLFWLVMWTIGGATALITFLSEHEPFLAVWLVFWALAWVLVSAQLAFMLTGSEFVRCVGGDLEIGFRSAIFRKTRRYQGSAISKLGASESSIPFGRWAGGMQGGPMSMLGWGRFGSIRFDYGARTIFAAAGLDSAEGQMIVDYLRRSLPNAG